MYNGQNQVSVKKKVNSRNNYTDWIDRVYIICRMMCKYEILMKLDLLITGTIIYSDR